ncbi:uncharacterized protein N7529_009494 [Penicillium soppii]|uniref:uncharacterized protein n=1 Tax=Penicillium soppii TaxID=69789 RepID=UPI002549B002|nr:uncharacterized protein N7529_009494 [Penicillium soppii]KAJ5855550.1 hypothetical protein N7529_009494 [Penicillium soppii]
MPPSYKRTVSAVRNKLNELRDQNPHLWLKEEGWNRAAVIEYLYESMADLAHVNRLLNLTAADIDNIITRVCILSSLVNVRNSIC